MFDPFLLSLGSSQSGLGKSVSAVDFAHQTNDFCSQTRLKNTSQRGKNNYVLMFLFDQ
jgi:hypothetical protein